MSNKDRPIKRKRVKKQKIQRKRRKIEIDEKENSLNFEVPNVNPNVEFRNKNNVQFNEDISESDDFKEKCFNELWNELFLRSLINVLYAHNCLNDFMILLRQLVSGSLPVNNIAFLICLERAKWQSLCSTAAMRF